MKGGLNPSEAAIVLRRAAELGAGRRLGPESARRISPEALAEAAASVGIPEEDVRRALADLLHEKAADPDSLSKRLYGSARLRVDREITRPAEDAREHLERMLRTEQGLKLRRRTRVDSLWDPGDLLGAVRRALDFSGSRPLLKARSVELRVEGLEDRRCSASLTADVSNQRGEYLSLGGILGATFAIPLAIAGAYEWLYSLAIPPALAAPGLGFRYAYSRACADIRRALDDLLDAAEKGPAAEDALPDGESPSPVRIHRPNSVRKFTPKSRPDE